MKILLSILEILMILGIITNYKLLKKRKEEKKEEWLISYLFIKLIDMKRYLLVFLKKEGGFKLLLFWYTKYWCKEYYSCKNRI